jgi:elongation factor Ts
MAEIKAADVAKLRKMTGAGMMDCKNALLESDGDFDKAIDAIRKRGKAIANKRADRDATEGAVLAGVTGDGKRGAIITLNCETDFVAKNEDFINFANKILSAAIEYNPANLEALKAIKVNGETIEDIITNQSGITGEKLDLSYFDKIDAEQVVPYIHQGNKLATLVGFNKKLKDIQIGKDVAMQIAAMSPVAVDKDFVDEATIAKELEIGREQARQEGKTEDMLDKIAMGKLAKFFKEMTLLNQTFVKTNKEDVRTYLKSSDSELTVNEFKRYGLVN